MKKAEFWKGFGAGFAALLLIMCLCATAFAASRRTIDVEDGVGLSINGAVFIPRDVTGRQVPVFLYSGTTYVPVRAISEALGLDVRFDSANRMVQLTTQDRLLTQGGASGSYISAERAKEIALADAGLKEGAAIFLKVKLEMDDGRYQYDVEFYSGSVGYDYEIDAITGKILSMDQELDDFIVPGSPSGSGTISADQAKEIALADAGVSAGSAVFTKTKLDRDDGRMVYEVEFYSGTTEYEYKIDAATGKILSAERDTNGSAAPGGSTGAGTISADRAKEIALADAGVSAGGAVFTKVKLDWDDGRTVYKVEFYAGSMEYEYEISAETGSIISRDIERRN